jgi:hypothetical protein
MVLKTNVKVTCEMYPQCHTFLLNLFESFMFLLLTTKCTQHGKKTINLCERQISQIWEDVMTFLEIFLYYTF